MAQQTAVEWLHLKLKEWANLHSGFDTLIEQAKEMFQQQIEDAFVAGDERGTKDIPFNAEQYYTQTYGK
jgi:hypothetical protein